MHDESQAFMEERRSHSYDESFLYYGGGLPSTAIVDKTTIDGYEKGPSALTMRTREPSRVVSRDDIGLGTTVVSPLGRFRAQYEHQTKMRNFAPRILRPVTPDDNESVPFDQEQDAHLEKTRFYSREMSHPVRTVRPFDEESTGPAESSPLGSPNNRPVIQSRVHGPHRSTAHINPLLQQQYQNEQQVQGQDAMQRFRMPPARVSKPALDAGVEDEEAAENEGDFGGDYAFDETPDTLGDARNGVPLSPGSTKVSVVAHPPGSPEYARMRAIDDAYEEFGIGNGSLSSVNNTNVGNATEEDDSLFDFGERQQQQQRQQRRSSKKSKTPTPGDETSEDGANEPSTSLTIRAQEAWKRKSARERKTKADANNVSFAANDPTVHRYGYNTETSTIAARSLNSEYTKSVESEVEDAIKDIFLIGSGTGSQPGRRKLKHRPDFRRQIRYEKAHPRADDDTLESADEDMQRGKYVVEGMPKKRGARKNDFGKDSGAIIRSIVPREEKKDAHGDALLGAWNMVETGLQAMGAAFGLDAADDETLFTYDDSRRGEDSEAHEVESRSISQRGGDRSRPNKKSSRRPSVGESNDSSVSPSTDGKSLERRDVIDYGWGAFLGGNSTNKTPTVTTVSENDTMNKKKEEREVTSSPKKKSSSEKGPPPLDKDLRLIEMAIQSARSFHNLRGVVYDESDVDIVTDIKFVVVDLTLPLGLIFQENESGCWVTKVLTEGSAIKKSIQVGDQLAAIDGKSAIRLRVEDIAMAIREKQRRPFELTFLRYVGPVRAKVGEFEEEGHEIKNRLAAAEAEHKGLRGRRKAKAASIGTKKNATPGGDDSPTQEKRRFRFFGRKK